MVVPVLSGAVAGLEFNISLLVWELLFYVERDTQMLTISGSFCIYRCVLIMCVCCLRLHLLVGTGAVRCSSVRPSSTCGFHGHFGPPPHTNVGVLSFLVPLVVQARLGLASVVGEGTVYQPDTCLHLTRMSLFLNNARVLEPVLVQPNLAWLGFSNE